MPPRKVRKEPTPPDSDDSMDETPLQAEEPSGPVSPKTARANRVARRSRPNLEAEEEALKVR